ncbi:MAG: hypothetical protein R2822_31195 [Spirosomataceae bacterium]
MKTIKIPLLSLLLGLGASAMAQFIPQIKQYDAVMSEGVRPVYEMRIENTQYKRLRDVWKDYAKETFNKRLKGRSGEYNATNITSPLISSNKFDLFSTVEESGNDAVLKVWFKTGDIFLSAATDSLHNASAIETLTRFYKEVRKDQATDAVTAEEENLKKAERDLTNLIDNNASLKKGIEDYKEKIKKAEQAIIENEKLQIEVRKTIENRRTTLEEVRAKLKKIDTQN